MLRLLLLAGVLAGGAVVFSRAAPQLLAGLETTERLPAETATAQPAQAIASGTRRVTLAADAGGHFNVAVKVNGREVSFLVDTGATLVAIDEATARRLNLRPARSDFTARVATANGEVAVAPIVLRELRIGSILLRDVDAVVIPGEVLPANLLGMSFLGRLGRFTVADDQLVLSQ